MYYLLTAGGAHLPLKKRTSMLNKLKAWIAPNTVTKDPNDKILVLDAAGKVGLDKIYEEMKGEDTGLRQETIVHVVSLYERVVARLLMNGYQVNTGLFYAVPRLTGVVEGGRWNPARNSIYVSFNQDRVLCEEIRKTEVEILTEKPDVMYVIETEDKATGRKDGSMTPGRNFSIRGSYLRVVGNDAAVGVTFSHSETKAVTKLTPDFFGLNNPAELMFVVPQLASGTYELCVTTQYARNNTLLKQTRSLSITVTVGIEDGPESEKPDEI